MEKISWTDHVRNEEVLLRVKEERNILRTIKTRKYNWISHILRSNGLLKQIIDGRIVRGIEVAVIQGRKRKQLPDDLKETKKYSKFKKEALGRTL
jgi:ribosomal protein L24E